MMAQSVLHFHFSSPKNSGQSNRRMSLSCWCLLALAAPFLVLQLGPVLGISEERRERLYFEYTRKLGHDLANPNTYEIRTLSNLPFCGNILLYKKQASKSIKSLNCLTDETFKNPLTACLGKCNVKRDCSAVIVKKYVSFC